MRNLRPERRCRGLLRSAETRGCRPARSTTTPFLPMPCISEIRVDRRRRCRIVLQFPACAHRLSCPALLRPEALTAAVANYRAANLFLTILLFSKLRGEHAACGFQEGGEGHSQTDFS